VIQGKDENWSRPHIEKKMNTLLWPGTHVLNVTSVKPTYQFEMQSSQKPEEEKKRAYLRRVHYHHIRPAPNRCSMLM
jgi:hypothetical protein